MKSSLKYMIILPLIQRFVLINRPQVALNFMQELAPDLILFSNQN